MSASQTSRPEPASTPIGGQDHDGAGLGPERTQWAQLGVICAASFVVWAGFGAILPYLPVFLQEQAHASVWLIGVIAAAFYVGSFAFSALFGRLSDSIGRKPVIVAGIAFFALAQLLFISTTDPAWFVFFRFLEGVGAAAVSPAAQALVADVSAEKDRSRAYGWMTTAQFGGLVAGPVLAWPLYSLGGGEGIWAFYTIFLFGSALSLLTAFALMIVVREPEHARRRRQVKVKHPPYRELVTKPVLAFLIVAATGQFAMGVFEVLWSLWLRHLGASVRFIGFTWIAFSAPMMLAFVGGYLADRYSRWALMFSGYTVVAFAWIVYGSTDNLLLFLVVNVIEGLAFAWSYPAKQGFLVQVAPPRWLGSVQGLEASSVQVAALIGTLLAPVLYGYMSGWVISMAGVVSLVGLALAAPVLHREWRRLKMNEEIVEKSDDEPIDIPRIRI
jgi:DHA1 family multidrug resistance protein-like MFS transporter